MICNPNSAISNLLRARLYEAVKGKTNSASTAELIGCSIRRFIGQLESQFEGGMTLKNHGEWHIDHRRPCASFNLVNEEEQRMCFHHTNLQPMWAPENLTKSDSFDEESFEWEWTGEKWEPIE